MRLCDGRILKVPYLILSGLDLMYYCVFLPLGNEGSSFKLILCHEIGHALGVNDSNDRETIMYADASGSQAPDNVLDSDSKKAIRSLYYISYRTRSQSHPQRYRNRAYNYRPR